MTTTTEAAVPAEVKGYLDDVAAHLVSLPWLSDTDRADLLDDLNQHLSEVAAEEGPPLAERLGPPAAYAEELVAAAGLEPPDPPADGAPAAVQLGVVLAGLWERLRRAVAQAGELRPAWWILRGYLAASLLAAVTGGLEDRSGHPGFPLPAVFGSPVVGLFTVAAAVKLSVRLGREGRPARRWATRAATAGLAMYGLLLLVNLGGKHGAVQWVETAAPITNGGCLLNGAGRTIQNLYPYDTQGRLLEQVLLYDQTGRPLDNLCPDEYDEQGRPIATEYGRDQNGAPVINVFPRRQTVSPSPVAGPEQFGVPTTAAMDPRPVSPPAVVVPRLATTTSTAAPTPPSAPTAGAPTTAPGATSSTPPSTTAGEATTTFAPQRPATGGPGQ